MVKRLVKPMVLLLISCLPLIACAAPRDSSPSPDAVSAATMGRYRQGELRDHNGVKLDPAVGPRDNSISGIQQVDIAGFSLTIDGLVQSPTQLSDDQVRSLPSETRLVTIHCVEGWDATILWKGVPMDELMNTATVEPDAKTVIFHAVDGYTTSLPLHEILDRDLMLAYDANGLPLPPEMGFPFIFVAEDKWGYKWARWVNRVELSSDTDYRGYWEQNGYSNEGNVTPAP